MLKQFATALLLLSSVNAENLTDKTSTKPAITAEKATTLKPEDSKVLSTPSPEKKEGDMEAAKKADKTGTNPINFTNDLRFYTDFQELNLSGNDGKNVVSTMEYRMPILDGAWQFRLKVPHVSTDIDGGFDESGLGDINFRLLTVPYLNKKDKWAIAVGSEFFLPTASEEGLGAESLSVAPQIFWVKFNPLGLKGWIFAPAYQHKLSVEHTGGSEKDINQSLLDFYFVWASADKQNWALIDPAVVIDHETNESFCILDVEYGTMLDKYLGTQGHSVYVRPSVAIGNDRPIDYGFEFGYKIVW